MIRDKIRLGTAVPRTDLAAPRSTLVPKAQLGQSSAALSPGPVAPARANGPPGPLELADPAAQKAIAQSLEALGTPHPGAMLPSGSYVPRSVEVDRLGMFHVRLDRMEDGLPVTGAQALAHIDDQGVTLGGSDRALDFAPLARTAPSVSSDQALALARKVWAKAQAADCPEHSSCQRIYCRAADGLYHQAYQFDLGAGPDSYRFWIDAHSGEILASFDPVPDGSPPVWSTHPTVRSTELRQQVSPALPIPDDGQAESTIRIGPNLGLEHALVDVDITHPSPNDLKLDLTSPDGTQVNLFMMGAPVGQKNLHRTFDATPFLRGENASGDWVLTATDQMAGDQGMLDHWGVRLSGTPRPPIVDPHPPSQPGTGSLLYSGLVPLTTHSNPDGTWSLTDDSRGGSQTLDAENLNRPKDAEGVPFVDADNIWEEPTDPRRTKAALDAQYGIEMTWDFYRDILGRTSIDGQGMPITAYVHLGNHYDNAYWDGAKALFGDGDGIQLGPMVAIDMVAHEISHGLIQHTANLLYQGQSGALNESWADILSKGVQWYAAKRNPDVHFDWGAGTAATTPNNGDSTDALRYLDDPTKDGVSIDNFKSYTPDVELHHASGIANNAFYLTVEGGTNRTSGLKVDQGIGMEKAIAIYYRALAYYLSPDATFHDAAMACCRAANDLYGPSSPESSAVTQAWKATGVLS